MKLFEGIMQHLDLLEALTSATKALNHAAVNAQVDLVWQITENRDRLINVIRTIQTRIEDDINELELSTVGKEHIDILKTWSQEVNQVIFLNDKLDQETTALLIEQKDQAATEIGSVFKNRQSVKGYDLSNVKK